MRGRFLAVALLSVVAFAGGAPAYSEEPLHIRVDRCIEAVHSGPFAELSNDSEFLRRLSLDLLGVIPTADEVRIFLADKSLDKRTRTIDRMLASDRHTRRMVEWLDTTFMERRPHRWVPEAEFQAFLFDFYKANKPYRELLRDMLLCDGGDLAKRGPARFMLDREVDPNVMAREVGRLFFGRDVQCAQCHDHPNVDDYLQSEFQGLAAFFNRSYLFPIDENNRKASIGEKAEGDTNYNSVFQPASKFTAKPHLPGEDPPADPAVAKGKEYKTKPDAKNRGVPTFSRRQQFAMLAAKGDNIWFNRNIVNRIWALMMGRGLVTPVDFQHSDNPPSNPELLDLLAKDFAAHGHDLRYLLRELALSKAYQRSVDMPENLDSQSASVAAQLPVLIASEKSAKDVQAKQQSVVAKQKSAIKAADKELAAARKRAEVAEGAVADAKKALAAAEKPLADAKAQLTSKRVAVVALQEAAAKAQIAAKTVAGDKELSQTAMLLQSKSKRVADEILNLQKLVERLGPSLVDLQKKVVAAQAVLEIASKPVAAIEAKLIPMRRTFYAESDKLGQLRTIWRHSQRRLASAKSYIEFGKTAAAWKQQRIGPDRIREELAAAERGLRLERAAAVAASQSYAESKRMLESAVAEVARVKQKTADRQAALQQLVANLEPLEASARTFTQLATASVNANVTVKSPTPKTELLAAVDVLKVEIGRASTQLGRVEASVADAENNVRLLTAKIAESKTAVAAANARFDIADKRLHEVAKRLATARAAVAKFETGYESAKTTLIENWTTELAVAALKPLSPEQLGWSALQATGVMANYRRQGEAELSKLQQQPVATSIAAAKPTAKTAPTPAQVDEWVHNKLKSSLVEFVRLYGGSPGTPQDVFCSAADQALFMGNSGTMNAWISPNGESVTARAAKAVDAPKVAEEIYLTVLSRMPIEDEIADIADLLARRPNEKTAVVQQIVWSLLASVEFRFNH